MTTILSAIGYTVAVVVPLGIGVSIGYFMLTATLMGLRTMVQSTDEAALETAQTPATVLQFQLKAANQASDREDLELAA